LVFAPINAKATDELHTYIRFLQVLDSLVSPVSSSHKTAVQWHLHRLSRTLIATGEERKYEYTKMLYICSEMSELLIILQNIPEFKVGSYLKSQGFSGPRIGIIFTYLKSYF
jgi:hypothetical protein